MGHNVKLCMFIAVIVIVCVVIMLHSDPLIAGFVGLQRADDRLIEKKNVYYVIFHYYVERRLNI